MRIIHGGLNPVHGNISLAPGIYMIGQAGLVVTNEENCCKLVNDGGPSVDARKVVRTG